MLNNDNKCQSERVCFVAILAFEVWKVISFEFHLFSMRFHVLTNLSSMEFVSPYKLKCNKRVLSFNAVKESLIF